MGRIGKGTAQEKARRGSGWNEGGSPVSYGRPWWPVLVSESGPEFPTRESKVSQETERDASYPRNQNPGLCILPLNFGEVLIPGCQFSRR